MKFINSFAGILTTLRSFQEIRNFSASDLSKIRDPFTRIKSLLFEKAFKRCSWVAKLVCLAAYTLGIEIVLEEECRGADGEQGLPKVGADGGGKEDVEQEGGGE